MSLSSIFGWVLGGGSGASRSQKAQPAPAHHHQPDHSHNRQPHQQQPPSSHRRSTRDDDRDDREHERDAARRHAGGGPASSNGRPRRYATSPAQTRHAHAHYSRERSHSRERSPSRDHRRRARRDRRSESSSRSRSRSRSRHRRMDYRVSGRGHAPAPARHQHRSSRHPRQSRRTPSHSRSPSPVARHSSRRHRRSSSSSRSRSASPRRRRSHSVSETSSHGRSLSASSSRDESESASESDGGVDDTEGMANIAVGSLIRERYEVLSVAGQGTFGTVLDVYDRIARERLALKVVRSVPRYLDAAQVEVDILEKIRAADPQSRSLCVRFIKQFRITHRGQEHVVLAFEKLGRSLYDFLKKNKYRGFSLKHVAHFGYQLLTSIAFCHRLKLIHTDLKPENILLRHSDYRIVKEYTRYRDEAHAAHRIQLDEKQKRAQRRLASSSFAAASSSSAYASDSSDSPAAVGATAAALSIRDKTDREFREPLDTSIRLIDFGGATFEHEHHSRIVNTRQYRAPEVLLGCGWSYPSDLWSVGCILPELFSGELLFGTHEDLEHLALMEKILERPLSESLTKQAIEPYQRSDAEAIRRGEAPRRSESLNRSRSRSQLERERSSSSPRADLILHRRTGRLRWPDGARSEKSLKTVKSAQTLRQLLPDADFLDLIQQLLTYDPARRITAEKALQHPFFKQVRQEEERRERDRISHARSATPAAAPSRSHSSRSAPPRRTDDTREQRRPRNSQSRNSQSRSSALPPPPSSRDQAKRKRRGDSQSESYSDASSESSSEDERKDGTSRPRRRPEAARRYDNDDRATKRTKK